MYVDILPDIALSILIKAFWLFMMATKAEKRAYIHTTTKFVLFILLKAWPIPDECLQHFTALLVCVVDSTCINNAGMPRSKNGLTSRSK